MYYIGYCNKFIAWQTWDLLRLTFYGFIEFVDYFIAKYPTYIVHPIRLSGSAIETYFSELRAVASGNLNACNYASASATVQVRRRTQQEA